MEGAIEKRVEVLEAFERVHDARVGELEQRMKKVETEGRALALAAQAVQALAGKLDDALSSIEDIAERAAQKAVYREREQRANSLRRRATMWAAVVGGFGAGIYTILEIVLSFAGHR